MFKNLAFDAYSPVICILAFGLFLSIIHPSITAGDSGEIIAASFSLGISHPPGYPLFALISKGFSMIVPFGNIALRVNIISAVFGALSCLMVYLTASKVIEKNMGLNAGKMLPCLAPLFLAFSYEFCYRSTVAEVYTLNSFLILMIIYVLLVWRDTVALSFTGNLYPLGINPNATTGLLPSQYTFHASRLLYLASFLLGLGIGNHHTIALAVPGAVVFVILNQHKAGYKRVYMLTALITFFFLAGFSVNLYLPVRSSGDPFVDWGDPQNARNFLDVFTRKTYLPEEMTRTWRLFVNQLSSYNPVMEFTAGGMLFGVLGIWASLRSSLPIGILLVLTMLLFSYGLIVMAGSSAGDINILKKFFLPSYALFSILIVAGMASVSGAKFSSEAVSRTVNTALFCAAAIILLRQAVSHFPRTSNPGNYLAYDYGMNELNSFKEGAVYISKGEVKTFPLWYVQGVERYREDVKVITAYFLNQRWYLKEALNLTGRHLHSDSGGYRQIMVDAIYRGNTARGVYIGFLNKEYIPAGLHTYTQGITFQLYTDASEMAAADVWQKYQMRGVDKVEEELNRGVVEILKDYASSHYNTGIESYEKGDRERALVEFEKAVYINPDDPDALNNLAAIYAEKGIRLKEAEEMAIKALNLYKKEEDVAFAGKTLYEIRAKGKIPIGSGSL